ncbi:Molybdopterin guanine dinucleotide synthesis protein B [uncultured archaeon]|nr:Molybdopterin guanine dinucleotide synthesis protein B [uncultured archaeon]
MKVISVVGTKKTGKTTLVTALVKSLKQHGRVGTIKNMGGHPTDRGDTRRHFEAGADTVIGLCDSQLKVTSRGTLESALAELQEDGLDYVVVEGFKHSNLPKIVLGEIKVPGTMRELDISELDEATIADLTELVLGMEEYRPLPGIPRLKHSG